VESERRRRSILSGRVTYCRPELRRRQFAEAAGDAIVAADPQGKIVFILRDDTERWKLEHGK
jgi:hypothetical protein